MNYYFPFLLLLFVSSELRSKTDSIGIIHHSVHHSASYSGDGNGIIAYGPGYRLYSKRNVFSVSANFINRYLDYLLLYGTGIQLSGFSLGYGYRLNKKAQRINISLKLEGVYNYLNEKIIVRRRSVYELYLGFETEAYLSKRLYMNVTYAAGLNHRDDRFDFPIHYPKSIGEEIGGGVLLRLGGGYKF